MEHEGMHFSLISVVIAGQRRSRDAGRQADGSVLLAGSTIAARMLMAAPHGWIWRRCSSTRALYTAAGQLSTTATRRHHHWRLRGGRACSRFDESRRHVDAIERAICPGEGHAAACTPLTPWPAPPGARHVVAGQRSTAATDPPATFARRSGQAVVELRHGITARDILTKGVRKLSRGGNGVRRLDQRWCCICWPSPRGQHYHFQDFSRIGSGCRIWRCKPFGDRHIGVCRWL